MAMQLRQGDLLLEKSKTRYTGNMLLVSRKNEQLILAEGEATGHNHVLDGADDQVQLFETSEDEVNGRVIVVNETITLTHDEHDELDLEPGTYIVTRQREYEEPLPPTRTRAATPARSAWVYD